VVNKLVGLAAIILGFLVMAAGYRYGSSGYFIAGIVFIAVGLAALVLKVLRRDPRRDT